MLSLAISFFASYMNLGDIADKVLEIIAQVRGMVDQAIDKAIEWIVAKAKALFKKLFGKDEDDRTDEEKQADLEAAIEKAEALQDDPKATDASVRAGLGSIKSEYRMQSLELVVDNEGELDETAHVEGEINPKKNSHSGRLQKDGTVGPLGITRKMLSWKQATLDYFKKDKYWDKIDAIPGDYESAEVDIRHKVSISDTIENTDHAISPKKVDDACEMLEEKGAKYKPDRKTKPGIVDAAREFLQDANNDLNNLFLGDARVNRRTGRRYDPGDKGDAYAAKHKKHKEDFAEKWGFKDEEFTITLELNSKSRGTEEDWETITP